jgi:hypothetical protein
MLGVLDHFLRLPQVSFIFNTILFTWKSVLRAVCTALRRSTAGSTAKQHAFPLTYEQLSARKQEFLDSLDKAAICTLASRHNQHKPCRIFHTSNGSFNACFFVEFPEDGTRWVVRIPIKPAVDDAWAKLQSEVTTMRFVRCDLHVQW